MGTLREPPFHPMYTLQLCVWVDSPDEIIATLGATCMCYALRLRRQLAAFVWVANVKSPREFIIKTFSTKGPISYNKN